MQSGYRSCKISVYGTLPLLVEKLFHLALVSQDLVQLALFLLHNEVPVLQEDRQHQKTPLFLRILSLGPLEWRRRCSKQAKIVVGDAISIFIELVCLV